MAKLTRNEISVSAKEVVLKLDGAISELASASQDFCDLGGLLEAIAAASEPASLARRLADFGRHICDDKESGYQRESDRLNEIVAGYLAILDRAEAA